MAHNRWSSGSYENAVNLSDSSSVSPPDLNNYVPYQTGLDSSYSDYAAASYYANWSQPANPVYSQTSRVKSEPRANAGGIIVPSNTKPVNSSNIKVELLEQQLWKQFSQFGTEMIITKIGRRMFPTLRIRVSGLEASRKYFMFIDIMPMDENRYKYSDSKWMVSGKAELPIENRSYQHPDSPLSGNQWMKQMISFHKLKLTNNPYDQSNHIVLHSMHKYVPRLLVLDALTQTIVQHHVFWDAQFIAVTAYQNENITRLKIENNPFAKGFREGNNRKDFRVKREEDEENDQESQQPNKRNSIEAFNSLSQIQQVEIIKPPITTSAQQYFPYYCQPSSAFSSHIGHMYEHQLQNPYYQHFY